MVFGNKLVVRNALLDWARKKSYPLSVSTAREDLMFLKGLEHSLGETFDPRDQVERETFERERKTDLDAVAGAILEGRYVDSHQLKRAMIEGNKNLELLSLPTSNQFVYTPTGYVEYCLNVGDDDMSESTTTESNILRCIERGDFNESLYLKHGPILRNWESDRVTVGERDENSDLCVTLNFDTPRNQIIHASISPVYHGIDRNYFELAREGETRLNNLAYAIGRLCGSGAVIPNLDGKEIEGSPASIFGVKTNLDLAFNRFDTIIGYTP